MTTFDPLEPRILCKHPRPIDPVPSPGNPDSAITFAAIGDYGYKGVGEPLTSALVHAWNPDFIITVGDNNYPSGSSKTIDRNVGQYFQDYIYPYAGKYGAGSPTGENRFFPVPGNHDWDASGLKPYLNYFNLPNNERYYDFVKGAVHFFGLDSEPQEKDGTSASSTQAKWLQAGLAASTSAFNVVYLHKPPYSSGKNGSNKGLQWPFAAWGADAVLAGHDHDYERIIGPKDNLPYFVNGAGAGRRGFGKPTTGSAVRYNDFGAMRIYASPRRMEFVFEGVDGTLVDDFVIRARDHSQPIPAPRKHRHHAVAAMAATAVITPPPPTTALPFSDQPLARRAQRSLVVEQGDEDTLW
jgi:tartrate-resistant acid phosphatase type 5